MLFFSLKVCLLSTNKLTNYSSQTSENKWKGKCYGYLPYYFVSGDALLLCQYDQVLSLQDSSHFLLYKLKLRVHSLTGLKPFRTGASPCFGMWKLMVKMNILFLFCFVFLIYNLNELADFKSCIWMPLESEEQENLLFPVSNFT